MLTEVDGEAGLLGRFRLGSEAARQPAHGRSYEAFDPATRTAATVTVVPSGGDLEFVERFLADVELLAGAEHRALSRVLDRGGTEDGAWLATSPVEGASLREIIDAGGQLVPMRAVRLLGDVADGLDAIHAAGLLHRQLSADAVVVRELPIERPVLWDLALGRPPDSSLGSNLPGYRSPEELRGEPATPSSDHYALACLLFEVLTGGPPGKAGSWHTLPAGLEPTLAAGLAEDPARRPASARELLSEAARVLVGGESAPATEPPAPVETSTETPAAPRPSAAAPPRAAARPTRPPAPPPRPAAAPPRPAASPSPRRRRRGGLLGALGIPLDRPGSSADKTPPQPAKPDSAFAEKIQEERRAARELRAREEEAWEREERERQARAEPQSQERGAPGISVARPGSSASKAPAPQQARPASPFAEKTLEERRVARERRAGERRAREQEARDHEERERRLHGEWERREREREERERREREREREERQREEREREERESKARAEREARERQSVQERAAREREREATAAAAASGAPTAEHVAPKEPIPALPRPVEASVPPVERPADSGRRRRPTPVALALIVIVAAGIVGFLAGQTGEDRAVGPRNATASAGPLSVNVPESWDRGEKEPPGGPGLREPVSANKGGGRLAAGMVESTGGVLYPRETASRGLVRPGAPDAVRLGGLEAWRFRGVSRSGEGRSTLFLSPTSAGMVAVSCTAPASAAADFLPACERAAASLSTDEDVRPVALSALSPYAARADRVLGRVASLRRRDRQALRRAPLRRTQARVASRLARSYRGGAEQLSRGVPRAARRQVTELVAALRRTAVGYLALAGATQRTDRRRYRAASRAIRSAEGAAARAAARL